MKTQYILELLKCCDTIADFKISADFLSKAAPCVSVKLEDAKTTQRAYCDGDRIFSKEAELEFRLFAGEGKSTENKSLLESFCEELILFGKGVSFPTPPAGVMPLKIKISEGAELISDELHTAKYRLKFKIYFMEKRG